jgi:hypothetical protein
MATTSIAKGVVTVKSTVCGADIPDGLVGHGKPCGRLPMHHGEHRLHLTQRAEARANRPKVAKVAKPKTATKRRAARSAKPTPAQLAARQKFAETYGRGRSAQGATKAAPEPKAPVKPARVTKSPKGSVASRSTASVRRTAKEAIAEAMAAGRLTPSEALALAAALA